jgi:hypothetical protein
MKSRTAPGIAASVLASLLAARAETEPKLLNRSLYVPVELVLCEHLEKGVLYQDDQPVSAMPARRVLQFTYYPDLQKMLPELVRLRVEGTYVEGGDPFVAKLAVTPEGIHVGHLTKTLHTEDTVSKQRHKIDVRLEPRRLELKCERFCTRTATVASGTY